MIRPPLTATAFDASRIALDAPVVSKMAYSILQRPLPCFHSGPRRGLKGHDVLIRAVPHVLPLDPAGQVRDRRFWPRHKGERYWARCGSLRNTGGGCGRLHR